jgi:hypothetical protein
MYFFNSLIILVITKFLCIHWNLCSLVLCYLHSYNSNPLFSIDFPPLYHSDWLILNHLCVYVEREEWMYLIITGFLE